MVMRWCGVVVVVVVVVVVKTGGGGPTLLPPGSPFSEQVDSAVPPKGGSLVPCPCPCPLVPIRCGHAADI